MARTEVGRVVAARAPASASTVERFLLRYRSDVPIPRRAPIASAGRGRRHPAHRAGSAREAGDRSSCNQLRMRPGSKHIWVEIRDDPRFGDQLLLGVQRSRTTAGSMNGHDRRDTPATADPLEAVVGGEQVTEERQTVGVRTVRLGRHRRRSRTPRRRPCSRNHAASLNTSSGALDHARGEMCGIG